MIHVKAVFTVSLLLNDFRMFNKKKKPVEISGPTSFEHRFHADIDNGKYVGIPPQWTNLLGNGAQGNHQQQTQQTFK